MFRKGVDFQISSIPRNCQGSLDAKADNQPALLIDAGGQNGQVAPGRAVGHLAGGGESGTVAGAGK